MEVVKCGELGIGVKICSRYCIDLPGTFLVYICDLSIIIYTVLSPSKMSYLENKLHGHPRNSYGSQVCLRSSSKIFHRIGQKNQRE